MVITPFEVLQLQALAKEMPARNPYDCKTWGHECARGIPYANTGAPVRSGTKGVVRKISTGRKARGSASADFDQQEQRKEIERCNVEIAKLQTQPADIPDRAYLVTMGEEDWKAEKRLLEGAE